MASHRFSVTSSLSPQQAFDLLVDLEHVTEWDDGIQSSTRVLDDSPEADRVLGARFDVVVTGFDGQPSSIVYTITEAETPHRFVMVGENDQMRATDIITLRATAGGCDVTYDAGLDLLGNDRPLSETQLESMFPKIAVVAQDGLRRFLNPET